jgi:polyribonucleotide nucleotidyltransferase
MWPPTFAGGASSSSPRPPEEKAETEKVIPIFLDRGVDETVPVPKALIGKVVGKRGSTIAEIRSESGAWKVDATDQSSDPCLVKVCGTADAVRKARRLINDLVENPFEKHAGSDFAEISQGKIGRIIGPKGAQVNEIEKQTGTKIDIDYEREPCRVYIQGSAEAVKTAKRIMEQICNEK